MPTHSRLRRLTLFHTGQCHLCELAETILVQVLNPEVFDVIAIDIALDDRQIDRYGVRIPVLRDDASGRELDWPFDAQDLIAFLSD